MVLTTPFCLWAQDLIQEIKTKTEDGWSSSHGYPEGFAGEPPPGCA